MLRQVTVQVPWTGRMAYDHSSMRVRALSPFKVIDALSVNSAVRGGETAAESIWRYVVATALVAVVLALKSAGLGLGEESPAVLLMAAILVAAVSVGLGPGLAAAALALVGVILVAPPGGSWQWGSGDAVFGAAFALEALVIVGVAEAMRGAVARRQSTSIENTRLYIDLQEREQAFERANEMLRFLLDTSTELSRTLDLDEMLAALTSGATPRVADWCVIVTLENGQPQARAASHRDPQWIERVRRLQEDFPFAPGPETPLMRALVDGVPAFLPEIPDGLMMAAATSDEHLERLKELGLRSAIIVPIRGSQRVYGVMTFVMSDSGRRYTPEDFSTLQDLVHRAALAFDNATLFQEATQREQELTRANEAQDEFMGMMSHELRTPLTIINGGARVLRSRANELDSGTKDEILADIEGESDRLFRMVENLLSLAHLQFSEPFEVEPVHAGHLAEEIVSTFRSRRPDREVLLEIERGAETFAAQPVYFGQVLRNLLSNADKYSPRGAPIEIKIGRAREGLGEIKVLDRGVGIEPAETQLIFERFYRSERTARLVGGSGVGLALCKRLVEAMSGQIWARPREGGGLEVGFSLPLYEEAFV